MTSRRVIRGDPSDFRVQVVRLLVASSCDGDREDGAATAIASFDSGDEFLEV